MSGALPTPAPGAGAARVGTLVTRLAQALVQQGWMMATAESCTGGLIAASCTEMAGSSAWFDRGVVTYSNEAKTELLGVDKQLISAHGAVSEQVALAMAQGVLRRSHARLGVAVTGIAGPGGGSADKPVGTVWLAWASPDGTRTEQRLFAGDPAQVRWQTVAAALEGLISLTEPQRAGS